MSSSKKREIRRLLPSEAAALIPQLDFDLAFYCKDILHQSVERYMNEGDDPMYSVLAGLAAIYEAGAAEGVQRARNASRFRDL